MWIQNVKNNIAVTAEINANPKIHKTGIIQDQKVKRHFQLIREKKNNKKSLILLKHP